MYILTRKRNQSLLLKGIYNGTKEGTNTQHNIAELKIYNIYLIIILFYVIVKEISRILVRRKKITQTYK